MAFNIGTILEKDEARQDDYFKILGCSDSSTVEQIITEYRIRALKCHPDKNPGNEEALQEFQTLQEARDVLTDPELRRSYDKWKQSEICIPYKKWLGMNQRCAPTMHWAKPKDQTMLESCSASDEAARQESLKDLNNPGATAFSDISRGSKKGWESDDTSNVYKDFRNYKI